MKGQVIKLKKEINEIIEAKKNGQKITYALNIYINQLTRSAMQVLFDEIYVTRSEIYFLKNDIVVFSMDKSIFKMEFCHINQFDDVFSLHYRLYL